MRPNARAGFVLGLTSVALAAAAVAGPSGRSHIGRCVASAGDLDGDGVADVIVGSCSDDERADPDPAAAAAIVWSGKDGKVLRRLRTTDEFPRGAAVAGVGDVNGDGVPDVAVGTPSGDAGEAICAGTVDLFSGKDGALLWTSHGTAAPEQDAQFGWCVAAAGDLDADGVPDLVGGSRGHEVHALSGRDGKVLLDLRRAGGATKSRFGSAVAAGTDVNGDGRPDVIVGAPFSGTWTDAAPQPPGEATLFSGKDGAALWTAKGEAAGESFGGSAAFTADVDGDGTKDVLVGAPASGTATAAMTGRVYVLSGKDGSVLRKIDGTAAGDALGTSVASVPDLDGDGVPEILAGTPGPPAGPRATSAPADCARVCSGKTGTTLYALRAPDDVETRQFRAGVAALPDVSGDKVPDLVVGAPGVGAVIFSGKDGSVVRVLR